MDLKQLLYWVLFWYLAVCADEMFYRWRKQENEQNQAKEHKPKNTRWL